MDPGSILVGRYRAGRQLGKGGMGVVIEATHVELGIGVAIKLLKEEAMQPATVERFLREARAAAQLRGENVCRVHDFGTLDDGVPFMVMELLVGCDLAALLQQMGPLQPGTVAAYIRQVCLGVAEAHALGVVHRDIKPTNLFRTRRPDGSALVKILDFGLAKSLNGDDFSLTKTKKVMGSPAYMSPEQLKSNKNVDPRGDVWSLGVVMYELVSNTRPFDGDSVTELALNITSEPPKPLPESVPEELRKIIMRCLEKDVAARFQSVAELAEVLEPLASPGTGAVPAIQDPPKRVEPSTQFDDQASAIMRAVKRSRQRAWFALAGSVALLAAIVLYIVWNHEATAETAAVVPPPSPSPTIAPVISVDAAEATPDALEPEVAVPDAAPEVTPEPKPTEKPRRPHSTPKPSTKPQDLRNSRY